MIRPGHLPRLEVYAAKAVQAIQKLTEKEREVLRPVVQELKAALLAQAAFNRRLSDSLLSVETETSDSTESLMVTWMHAGS